MVGVQIGGQLVGSANNINFESGEAHAEVGRDRINIRLVGPIPFTILDVNGASQQDTSYATWDEEPTTFEPVLAFAADESAILRGVLPPWFSSSKPLYLDIYGGANTATAANRSRWRVAGEYVTPNTNTTFGANNFDSTPDEATMTFGSVAFALMKITIPLTWATAPKIGDFFRLKVTRISHSTENTLGATDVLIKGFTLYQ